MGYPVQHGNTTDGLDFLLVLSSDHITGATGKTPTVTLLKSGSSAFSAAAGAVTELANGWYRLAANSTDANTLGPLLLHATATSCDPRDDTFSIVNYNPNNVAPFSPPTTATFGTTTARDLVEGAFMLIGAFDPETGSLSAQQGQDGLRRLNQMVAGWALQPGTILNNVREVFNVVANQREYSIGPGGDFDTVRPIYIQGASIALNYLSPVVERPLGLFTDDSYRNVAIKTLTSTQFTGLYYNATYPLGTIALYPVPNNATNDLVLYSLQAIAGFADLNTPYALAPGYAEAMEYNLAKRLATPWGRQLPGDVVQQAAASLAWVKTANARLVDVALDPGLTHGTRGVYNIFSDQPS